MRELGLVSKQPGSHAYRQAMLSGRISQIG
ncbi:hypothetical protein HMPREF1030_01541 [Pseudomonas aeruginosa]|nr:hypothetical protein HMPREF1030_01541 [Pseudomonas aeruginosa]